MLVWGGVGFWKSPTDFSLHPSCFGCLSFKFCLPSFCDSKKEPNGSLQGASHHGPSLVLEGTFLAALPLHRVGLPCLVKWVGSTTALLLMVQKSGNHQLRLVNYPIIYKGSFSSQLVQDFFPPKVTGKKCEIWTQILGWEKWWAENYCFLCLHLYQWKNMCCICFRTMFFPSFTWDPDMI